MPKESEHKRQYVHNKNLLINLLKENKDNYRDWAITITFYSAIHLIESKLAAIQFHSNNHNVRESVIYKMASLKSIASDYNALRIQSRRARYDCVSFSDNDLSDAIKCLDNIEQNIAT